MFSDNSKSKYKNNLFYTSLLKTFTLSKLCNIKCVLFKNVVFEEKKIPDYLKNNVVYILYISNDNFDINKSYLLIGVQENNSKINFTNNLKNNFFDKYSFFIDYIEILNIFSNEIFLNDFKNHLLYYKDQELMSLYIDVCESQNFFFKDIGFFKNNKENIVTNEIYDRYLNILNKNINNLEKNQLDFLTY